MERTRGGTNYNTWDKITNSLVTEVENDDKREEEEAAEALGHNRVPRSSAEAEEKAKAQMARKAKEALDKHQQRESNATAYLDDLLPTHSSAHEDNLEEKNLELLNNEPITSVVVDEAMLGKKRVIFIRNCHGPGSILLPCNLSTLPCTTRIQNDRDPMSKISIQGVIKVFIHNCHNCTIHMQCKIITSMIEISHCSNVDILVEHERISTIQADLSNKLTLRFMDSQCFGGKDDKIYHAGVSDTKILLMEGEIVKMEACIDYLKDGAIPQLNSTAEEYQFVTCIHNDSFLTERLIRMGNKSMTQRELNEERRKKGHCTTDKSQASISSVDLINEQVKQCAMHKSDGNEAFKSGEYAQAVLHYTMCIDKSTGLDEAIKKIAAENVPNFLERHIVFANRSACFLKLGHHDKALNDADACVSLNSSYVKGLFRKGLALHAMKRYQEAITVLASALKIEPKNKQIKQALQFAEVKNTMMIRKRMGS